MNLGDKLKNMRLSRGLTQEDVAKAIKVSIQTVYKYEQSIITNIPLDKIEGMAKLFDVDPASILGWSREEKNIHVQSAPLRPKQRILFDRSKELTDSQMDVVLNVVDAILKDKSDDNI